MKQHPTRHETVFTLEQTFNAPKELVFNAFANADALNEWWGPVESRNSVVSLDFRPGGIFHYKMESAAAVRYGRFLFCTIHPHDVLEFTNAFADEHAQPVKAPFDIPLPLEILYRLTFSEQDGKTTIMLTGKGVDASPEQEAGLHSINAGMQQGFGATFDQLSKYLHKQLPV